MGKARELYLALSSAFKQGGKTQASTGCLLKYLGTFEKTADAELAQARDVAAQLVTQVIGDPTVFKFEHVSGLKAVQQLKSDKAFELLSLLQRADLGAYSSWAKANGAAFAALGLAPEQVEHKARLLALIALCAANETLTFAAIAASLHITEADAEIWVIDGMTTRRKNA